MSNSEIQGNADKNLGSQSLNEARKPSPVLDAAPSFTPAPWQAEMHGQNVLACDQQMMICNVRGWGYLTGTGGLNLPEAEAVKIQDANVRLIAAAPSLYEAVRVALSLLESIRTNKGTSWAKAPEGDILREALALVNNPKD